MSIADPKHLTQSLVAVTLAGDFPKEHAMSDKVRCPACGKAYRWKDDLAGRKVKCKCGEVFRMTAPGSPAPSAPVVGSVTDKTGELSDGYDLHDTGLHAPAHGAAPGSSSDGDGRCPSCNQPVKPNAVICINCGFNLKSGQRLQTAVGKPTEEAPIGGKATAALTGGTSRIAKAVEDREDDTPTPKWKDLYLPAALIVLGVAVTFLQAFYFGDPDDRATFAEAAIAVGVKLVISVPVLFVAMLLAVKLLDVAFGPLGQALFKLVAIALGPDAIGGIIAVAIGGGIMGWFAGFMVSIIAFWVLLSVLLDLEAMEALYMMGLIWLVQYAATFLTLVILGAMFG